MSQVLIEEYLAGWKEIEYEVVRDRDNNTITVCNMENFDPMGVHTGESIVVAPSQTLTSQELDHLRDVSIATINHLGIIGECNIQYALNPATRDYRVIEVNARLSRSSALASKATGYPLAFVAAKIMLGKRLQEIKTNSADKTSAFYEPKLDYIALKMPRWDLTKLKSSDHHIGTEMKSVGEVMALGQSFPEVLQKSIRMCNIGADGLTYHNYEFDDALDEVEHPTDRRLYAIYEALQKGSSVDDIYQLSKIDDWFLQHMQDILEVEKLLQVSQLDKALLLRAKQMGFSDKTIATLKGESAQSIRKLRLQRGVRPVIRKVDTLTGDSDAVANYLYLTYHDTVNDVEPLEQRAIVVLGSGPYAIGSSVEFDWSAVNTVKTLAAHGHKTIVVNSNPETVSTDFDRSDRLYFDELTLERVQDIADFEKPQGIVVSVGGQIANNLALPLADSGYPILGTTAQNIDRAENRQKFSSMLHDIGIDQPAWQQVTTLAKAREFGNQVGYPVLIRPSYVLSGGAMNVVESEPEMEQYLRAATRLSPDHPIVISQLITGGKELEIDGVAKDGKLIIYAISEHIENAGIHSGDATVVYPAQRLYLETVRRTKRITQKVVKGLGITGPFNIQFIAKNNELKVIECNVRASRAFPFISKVSGHNLIQIATEAMLGVEDDTEYNTLDRDHVGVKTAQFSYNRMKGSDPVANVEMASTGEVACFGRNVEEAFYNSWLATEQQVKHKSLFVSLPDEYKYKYIEELTDLYSQGWKLYTTAGTYAYLQKHGIKSHLLHKIHTAVQPSVANGITERLFDLVVCVPSPDESINGAYDVRRLAVDNHIPIFTNAETGRLFLHCLANQQEFDSVPRHWQEYFDE